MRIVVNEQNLYKFLKNIQILNCKGYLSQKLRTRIGKLILNSTLCGIVLLFLSGCSINQKIYSVEELKKQRMETLSSINLNDGIGYEEAEVLSNLYFFSFVSRCGMPGKVLDKGDHWETEMIVGYAAQKMKDNLEIDKQTGKMTLRNWPTIMNPIKEFADPEISAPIIAGPLK